MANKGIIVESEKTLEKKFSKEIEKLGGLSIKLVGVHFAGLPDRLALLPGGILFFAEIKTTGKKPSKIQKLIHKRIRALGFKVFIVDKTSDIEHIINIYKLF